MLQFTSSNLASWTGGQWLNPAPPEVSGFSIDSRAIAPGQVYIAIRGGQRDGHEFVASAFARGASAAIVATEVSGAGPQLLVRDTRAALADLARGYRGQLSARFVGVTGSVGKTTTKELLADILGMAGVTARSKGNFNNDLGLPLSLLSVGREARFGVFEIGMNHAGELAPLAALLRPEIGIVTNVAPVHIEHFSGVAEIAREKAELLAAVPADGLAVLSRDEAWFDTLAAKSKAPVLTVALRADADYVAERRGAEQFSVREKSSGQRVDFFAPLPGEYFVANALLAIAVGRRVGLAWASIAEAVKNYRPIHLRWQRTVRGEVDVINDAYNANPVSMRAALAAFAETSVRGSRWLVLGGMRELGADSRRAHEELGRSLVGGPWAGLIAVGELARGIADGAASGGWAKKIVAAQTQAEAARALEELAGPGDAVLLKGSRGERVEEVLNAWKPEARKTEEARHE